LTLRLLDLLRLGTVNVVHHEHPIVTISQTFHAIDLIVYI